MRYAVAAVLIFLAGGCASPAPISAGPVSAGPVSAGPVSAGPVSAGPVSAGPVSAGPAASHPPRGFTDNDKSTGWIVGTVTAGGTGPCYGLITDDGIQYALHSIAGARLDKGARVRIQGTPAKIRINCGPGQLLEMTAAEPLR